LHSQPPPDSTKIPSALLANNQLAPCKANHASIAPKFHLPL